MRKGRINNIRIKRNIKVRVSIRKGKVTGIKARTSLFFGDSNFQNLNSMILFLFLNQYCYLTHFYFIFSFIFLFINIHKVHVNTI